MKIDYEYYEYKVIKKLMDIFKIESVCHEKEVEDIKGWVRQDGKLENKTLLTNVLSDYIRFNFKYNWSYCLNKEIISNAFCVNEDIEDIVNAIKKNIEYKWLKEIKK